MKKIKNFICFILILTSLVTFIPTASYAMGDATGEFRVIGCEYTRKKSGYTIHLVIKTINYDKQNFTATFLLTVIRRIPKKFQERSKKIEFGRVHQITNTIFRLKLIGKTAVITTLT